MAVMRRWFRLVAAAARRHPSRVDPSPLRVRLRYPQGEPTNASLNHTRSRGCLSIYGTALVGTSALDFDKSVSDAILKSFQERKKKQKNKK